MKAEFKEPGILKAISVSQQLLEEIKMMECIPTVISEWCEILDDNCRSMSEYDGLLNEICVMG